MGTVVLIDLPLLGRDIVPGGSFEHRGSVILCIQGKISVDGGTQSLATIGKNI